jgi:hypothetical protein
MTKEDIASIEELLLRYRALAVDKMSDTKVQELVAFVEKAIDNIKIAYKDQKNLFVKSIDKEEKDSRISLCKQSSKKPLVFLTKKY